MTLMLPNVAIAFKLLFGDERIKNILEEEFKRLSEKNPLINEA
jgi:hypothetical protein